MKILIDPGHRNNSNDFGATGNGLKESALALEISQKLKLELEKHNIVCYMTRETEKETISVGARPQKAKTLNVDLLISMHINSYNANSKGIEVLYKDQKELATDICNAMCKETGATNRGAKLRNDLGVLNGFEESVLIECGFISNPIEAKLMATTEYQNKLVKGIIDAVVAKYKITVNEWDGYHKAIMKLEEEININRAAWFPDPNAKNLPALVSKIGVKLYGTNDYVFTINRMKQDGIISDEVLWLEHEYNENHIKSLIKKVSRVLG